MRAESSLGQDAHRDAQRPRPNHRRGLVGPRKLQLSSILSLFLISNPFLMDEEFAAEGWDFASLIPTRLIGITERCKIKNQIFEEWRLMRLAEP